MKTFSKTLPAQLYANSRGIDLIKRMTILPQSLSCLQKHLTTRKNKNKPKTKKEEYGETHLKW